MEAEVAAAVQAAEAAMARMKAALEPVLTATPKELEAQLPAPLHRAQLHVAVAAAVSSLFQLYLKTQGVAVDSHPVKAELARIAVYQKKVDKAVYESTGPQQRSIAMDVKAVNRFIEHAIPDLTEDQKRQMQKVATRKDREKPESSKKKAKKRGDTPSAAATADEFLNRTAAELSNSMPVVGDEAEVEDTDAPVDVELTNADVTEAEGQRADDDESNEMSKKSKKRKKKDKLRAKK
eukprot:jgi/Chlat1/7050/Chrsp56S06719